MSKHPHLQFPLELVTFSRGLRRNGDEMCEIYHHCLGLPMDVGKKEVTQGKYFLKVFQLSYVTQLSSPILLLLFFFFFTYYGGAARSNRALSCFEQISQRETKALLIYLLLHQ